MMEWSTLPHPNANDENREKKGASTTTETATVTDHTPPPMSGGAVYDIHIRFRLRRSFI